MGDDGTVRSAPVWHDGGGAATGTEPAGVLDRRRRADVAVVGLGATGLTAAAELARAGADVVALDAIGVGAGAAGANGGFLLGGLASFHHEAVARHGRRTAATWYRRTLEELDRVVEEEPTARRVGSLRSAADDREVADLVDQRDALRRDGIAVEDVDGPLGPALLLPDDGTFDPMARCVRLAAEARDAGVTLVGGARAELVGATLRVGEVVVRARAVLVAVDGGLESAVPVLADVVTSIRLQMLATAPVPHRVLDRPTYHRWGLDYAQQLPGGELAVGGGRDLEDEAARGGGPSPTPVVQRHLDGLVRRLGVDDAVVTHRWAARSAYTDDRLPVDREVAPGVHVLGGYSGHGNVIGPMLARDAARRLLADVAVTRPAIRPVDASGDDGAR